MKRLLLLVLVVACKKEAPPAPAPAPPASSAPTVDVGTEARNLLAAWDRGFNAHDAASLAPLYASTVLYYGAKLSREDCTSKVASFIGANPTLSQASTVEGVTPEPGGARVTFTKAVTIAGKTTRYPSYVHLVRNGGALSIDEESDPITDKNLHIATCEDALSELARKTDGLSGDVSSVEHDGGVWKGIHFHSHGYNEVDFDPKTGKLVAGMGDNLPPLDVDANDPLIMAIKAKCK